MDQTVSAFWMEAVRLVPSLAVLTILMFGVFWFMKKKDDTFTAIAKSCHDSHERVTQLMVDCVDRNTEILMEVSGELDQLEKLRTEELHESKIMMEAAKRKG